MEKFDFASAPTIAFSGPTFYRVYHDAAFLRVDANVETILSRGYLVRQKVNSLPIGHSVVIEGMNLERNTPLIVKRAGKGVTVHDFEFTYNRLAGLVAAYAYENRRRFAVMKASEAEALGLVWDNENDEKCKLYLSAVSGTENMIDQFSFFPLICGLRKLQLKKMPLALVVSMGHVKNEDGVTMAQLLKKNLVLTKRMWLMFPAASLRQLQELCDETPEFKKMFLG